MQKFQIQLIVGQYTVNHIREGESKEEILEWINEELHFYKNSDSKIWQLEDVILDAKAVTLVRVIPYFEKVEETVEIEND